MQDEVLVNAGSETVHRLDLKSKLAANILAFGGVLDENGLPFKTANVAAWERFQSYPPQIQIAIAERFQKYVDAVLDIGNEGIPFRDTPRALWALLQRNRWILDDQIFSEIKNGDVVEVYLGDQTQVYRNFNYFYFSSYTLPELLFIPWEELIEHGPEPMIELTKIGQQIFVEQCSIRQRFKVQPYIARERFSEKKYEARLTSKFLSAIRGRDSGINEAVLVVWNIDLLNKADAPVIEN